MDKIVTTEEKKSPDMPALADKAKGGSKRSGGRPPFRSNRRADKPAEEFEQRIVDLARVTRVMAGGKRMKFRACMVIGDKKGRVSMGLAKGADVSQAIAKSVTQAKKHLQHVPIIDGTIPHQVTIKLKSAKLMIKPAKKGSGIKAGGVVRTVLELAGIKDVTAKILGGGNKINNVRATLEALNSFVPRSFPKSGSTANKSGVKAIETNKTAQNIRSKEQGKPLASK